jgi:opacity protein-like surface antigen
MQPSPLHACVLLLLASLAPVTASQASETWAGPHIGIEGLALAGNDRGREYNSAGYNGWKQDLNLDGYGFGVVAGYTWAPSASCLLGFEAGYRRYDANDQVYQVHEQDRSYCTPPEDCTISSKLDQAFSLTGRIGYPVTDSLVFYGTAGFTTAHLRRTVQDWGARGFARYDYDKWQTGPTYGVGAEYALGKGISAKLEYRYTDLGSYAFDTPAYRGVTEHYDYRQEEVSIGLNYRF